MSGALVADCQCLRAQTYLIGRSHLYFCFITLRSIYVVEGWKARKDRNDVDIIAGRCRR